MDSDKNRETQRKSTSENNVFFLNRQADLTLAGVPLFLRLKVEQFEDAEQLTTVTGNKALTDPAVFRGKLNMPYVTGFLNASYKETTDLDRNSPANQFRSAMGMNIQGTMSSSATMYANRYPWKEALQLFGAVNGVGAQAPKN